MKNASIEELLPRVRREVLELRASYWDPHFQQGIKEGLSGFGLSFITKRIARDTSERHFRYNKYTEDGRRQYNQSQYTSGSHKALRGHVQKCLSILAREGVMYGRNHAEGGVPRYAHGETDKRFRIRITQQQAIARLAKMKDPLHDGLRNTRAGRNAH